MATPDQSFSLRFSKIVQAKLDGGARRMRQDLLTDAVNKLNRQTVGKSKLNPDEVSAIHFFDQAPASLQRLLKIVWGAEAPQHTAITLQCVSLPFLNPKKAVTGSLKVQAQPNPLWREILTHSWPKVEEFVLRLRCKWDLKVREYLDRGVVPPIHKVNICAPFRDSGREVEVWMMSCLMKHFHAKIEAKYEPELGGVATWTPSWSQRPLLSALAMSWLT